MSAPPSMAERLVTSWTSQAWPLLRPLSVLYGGLLALRRSLYRLGWRRSERVGVPVIVVGNVVAGGAGKTPVVMALVEHLLSRGWHVGVISRGYGRRTEDCREVFPSSSPDHAGDEALLLRRRCGVPVFVAPRRVDAALALRLAHPEVGVIVCDDGLQHWALARDLEVCVFDDRGLGNGLLLPAGPLREPWPRKPWSAALNPPAMLGLVPPGMPRLTGLAPHVQRRALAPWAVRADGERVALTALAGAPVAAAAGIARPEAFFAMLRQAGLTLGSTLALPDHAGDAHWQHLPVSDDQPLLCTEKDAVKLWRHRPQTWAVPLQLDIAPAFFDALDAGLPPPQGPRAPVSSEDGPKTA